MQIKDELQKLRQIASPAKSAVNTHHCSKKSRIQALKNFEHELCRQYSRVILSIRQEIKRTRTADPDQFTSRTYGYDAGDQKGGH